MSVPARYPYARVHGDGDRECLIELTRLGPAYATGKLACGVFVQAPLPRVTLVRIDELSDAERERFRLPLRPA